MPNDNILVKLIDGIKLHKIDASLFSKNFIAFRDNEKKYYDNVTKTIDYYQKLTDDEIKNISYEKEDSHYLLYYSISNTKYISKIRVDDCDKIQSIIEEKYLENYFNIVLTIEYDGSNYYGIQRQLNIQYTTIQEEIEKALKRMTGFDIETIISSRTDRGVHALGQTIEFNSYGINEKKYLYALNNILPGDIRVKDAKRRSQLFNCRYDTIKKEYNYIINTGAYSVFNKNYCFYKKINDVDRMEKEMKALLGTHDFIMFCKGDNDNTIRTIYEASIIKENDKIILKFVGNGFLHNMIRFIVGSLTEIDEGKVPSMKYLLSSRNKRLTNKLAPASGLYLIKIDY